MSPAAVRWAVAGVGLIVCPLTSGCFVPVVWGWPTASMTPVLNVKAPAGEVRAFRVDVTDCRKSPPLGREDADQHVMSPLLVNSDGRVSPQVKLSADYGGHLFVVPAPMTPPPITHVHHTVWVRLYRPGYHTVEIKSWDLSGEIDWKKAATVDDQEKAVDDLLATWMTDRFLGSGSIGMFALVAFGSKSAGHRETLLFAATEYDRLRSLVLPSLENQEEARERLQAKAEWLRKRAAE